MQPMTNFAVSIVVYFFLKTWILKLRASATYQNLKSIFFPNITQQAHLDRVRLGILK